MSAAIAPGVESTRVASTTVASPAVTADAFYDLAARSRAHLELVRGEVRVMSPASGLHGLLCSRLVRLLDTHVDARGLGWCFTEATGFRLGIPGDAEESVRAPDVAFVTRERLPSVPPHGSLRVAPDLAVEVLSPQQTASEIVERLGDYLAAGTRVFWIVDPRTRRVVVHAVDGPMRVLREGDTLDGGTVVPGLAIAVADLFRDVPHEAVRRSDLPPAAPPADAPRDA